MALLDIFVGAILPIVAIAGAGFVLGRLREVDPGPLNTAVVYVLVPALVFHSLATAPLSGETIAKLTAAVTAYVLGMVVVAEGVGRLLGESEPGLSALVLAATFPNSGNYGIPLSDFAFPAGGRPTAVLYLAIQSVLIYTVGVYVASRAGGRGGLSGVKRVLYVPLVWAVPLALGVRWLGVVPPVDGSAMRTLQLVGDSSIPVMLLILGIQLARTDYGTALSQAWVPSLLKMGVAPALAVGVALLVGFSDPTVARVFVLESAMPAAITPVILVAEFAGEGRIGGVSIAEYVSTIVLVTTLASLPVLTGLIALLQSGLVL
ncbi:AEC family transporter [Halorarum salinum]|uniref:AEC family transporter n=1 Tax=Halorarum salinum TaxID=2743089 RepID=A0A7D5LC69_9EURY|nr:AEC family transporter [Halobaculum salinum]QLG62967.1 AEC family transporter [Halobaculum salinum]